MSRAHGRANQRPARLGFITTWLRSRWRSAILGACVILLYPMAVRCEDRIDGFPLWHENRPVPAESLPPRPTLGNQVEIYLARALLGVHIVGRVRFCAVDSIGSDQTGDTTHLYVWAFAAAFDSVAGGALTESSGSSFPVVVSELMKDDSAVILGHWEPPDDEDYGPYILRKFPKKPVNGVSQPKRSCDARSGSLHDEVIRRARAYFGMSGPEEPSGGH